jgi:hypothetical protein
MQAVTPPPGGGYPGGNTAEGFNALFNLSTQDGGFNTAVGFSSLAANVTGSFNTGIGAGALDFNTSHNNTAIGAAALFVNTTGNGNTATGAFALFSNATGPGNTAVGAAALFSNTGDNGNPPNGRFNTAVGLDALYSNTIGNGNTAVGAGLDQPHGDANGLAPLASNTTGNGNTAVGATDGVSPAALGSNTTGNGNTAVGAAVMSVAGALGLNTAGNFNTAIGQGALTLNTTGSENTAVGRNAGSGLTTGNGNVAVGNDAGGFTTGDGNIAVGNNAGGNLSTGNDNIDIGNPGVGADPPEANTIRIGTTFAPSSTPATGQNRTFIAGISGTAVTGTAVVVNSDGQLGVAPSSQRFKDEIKPMDKLSEAILALKPVTFRYKREFDPNGIPQFGLVAEEVAKLNPDLVVRDRNGDIYSVRYEAVNAMLLNEFLKARRQIDAQQKQIDALTAGLQKVRAQLEVSKPAPQTVLNNQ